MVTVMSLPVQGAWIEIADAYDYHAMRRGRSPCRERGLKLKHTVQIQKVVASLPVQGAWIEITWRSTRSLKTALSLPVQGAWIEIQNPADNSASTSASLPVQGAWIEITLCCSRSLFQK